MPTRLMIVVATALSTLAVPVAAANRKVDVINKTGMTMTSFFASSTGTESWEEDMLDNDTLDDGETLEADRAGSGNLDRRHRWIFGLNAA